MELTGLGFWTGGDERGALMINDEQGYNMEQGEWVQGNLVGGFWKKRTQAWDAWALNERIDLLGWLRHLESACCFQDNGKRRVLVVQNCLRMLAGNGGFR
jgi:hypothetical protein